MRSKAPLALMEQLVMVLVFALAAALCVQAFALSSQLSRRNEAQDRGLLEAQNMAETLKSLHGDYAQAAQSYGGSWDGAAWTLCFDENWQPCEQNAVYRVQAVPEVCEDPLLGTATITVSGADGQTILATLPTAWQLPQIPQTEEEAGHA